MKHRATERLDRIRNLGATLERIEIEEVPAATQHQRQPGRVRLQHGGTLSRGNLSSQPVISTLVSHVIGLEDEAERLRASMVGSMR